MSLLGVGCIHLLFYQSRPSSASFLSCSIAPSDTVYWQHVPSTERDFIYVTTQNLSPDQLQQLSDKVGPDRSLLVLCTALRGKADRWPNLTVKKIPRAVLSRCEWDHDDYSLSVENLPKAPPKLGQQSLFGEEED